MKKIKKMIKKFLGITALEENAEYTQKQIKALQYQIKLHQRFVNMKMAELRDFTKVDADIGLRGNNTVILTGIYKRRGYVHFYDIGPGEFEHLVDQLRNMKSYAQIRTIDAPHNFRGVFDI